MDVVHAIVLGVVEGITEFLPVSSTGHMIIVSHLMKIPQTEFLKTFEIAIQLGAIGAVFSMYWRVFLLDWEVGVKVLTAFVPTALIGFVLYKLIKKFLLGNILVVALALLVGGVFLIIFETLYKEKKSNIKQLNEISYRQAIMIGLCQSLAVIPGVSRSASTIVGGLMMGVSRMAIVEFSFLLAVPTMMAATVLDILKSSAEISSSEMGILAIGFGVAFLVAFAAVKFLLKYVQRNNFIPFGIYRVIVGLLLLLYFLFVPPAFADQAPLENVTLKECYQLALERSETIAIQGQVMKEAEGKFLQSLSAVLPKVSYQMTEKRQDGSGSSAFTLKNIPQRQFVFTQPLFSGFKEFAGMAASKAERKQRKQEMIRAKQLLFIDVSDAFYFLKSYQEDLKTLEDIDQAYTNHVTELKRRQSLGRSRLSEVSNTEAKLFQNEAVMEALRGEEQIAIKLLEFLTGKTIVSLAQEDIMTDNVLSEQEYMSKADARADVQAVAEASKVAHQQITIARAGFWPTVNVVGDYYTKRVGNAADVKWDVSLNVDVPIFNGTETFGEVKKAKAQAEESKLKLNLTKRLAVLDIQNAYIKLMQGQKQMLAFRKAVDAAQKNYDYQISDYRNSLVSNLDVLQSLEDVQTVKRSYIAIKNETQRNYWNLKVATGDITDDAL